MGWIIRNRQPLLVPNFDQRQSNLGYYADGEEASIKAFMGCPVPTGGALCVDSKRQYSFSDKDHKILQLFAELISRQQGSRGRQELAGDIPRYFAELGVIQDLRFRYKRWPQFLQNYLRTMADATGFDYCAFASVDAPGETYCVECESARLLLMDGEPLILPMGSGITGWVFRNDQPVVAEGVEGAPASVLFGKLPDMPDFQAAMCMPVMVNKSMRGLCWRTPVPARSTEHAASCARQWIIWRFFWRICTSKPACGPCCPRPRCTATDRRPMTRIPRPCRRAKSCKYVPAAFFSLFFQRHCHGSGHGQHPALYPGPRHCD
ncbi:MAG: GAF domain-containing protein [Desulfovibrio fairfieldensis]